MNEQTVLAIVHLFMVREHNRIARELGNINQHWEDEMIFQETRHIMAAIIQHITYNEFLPLVLGEDMMFEHGLSLHQVREDLIEFTSAKVLSSGWIFCWLRSLSKPLSYQQFCEPGLQVRNTPHSSAEPA